MNEIFLGDIDISPRLKAYQINLIYAPVGSGKSTWVKTDLIESVSDKRQILYLTDTTAGRDQAKNDAEDYLTHYSKEWDRLMNDNISGGWGTWKVLPPDKVPIMTFSKMAHLIKKNPDFGTGWLKHIVLDECHNLKIYQSFSDDDTLKRLEAWLKNILYNRDDITITALSATPKKIPLMFHPDRVVDILSQTEKDSLRTLKERHEPRNYASMKNMLSNLPNGRGVIYTSHIHKMIEYADIIKSNDKRNVEMIWSRNNEKYSLDNRQWEIWDSILQDAKIPDETEILMINASCQTGVNIKSHVDFMVIDEWDEDTITQARGRVRSDIDRLYLPSKVPDYFYLPSDLLGFPIYQEDKIKVIDAINVRNDGHLKKWITVSNLIRESDTYCFAKNKNNENEFFRDYSNGGDLRYHIIRLKD